MAYFDDLNPCESDDEYVPRGPTIPKKVQWVTPKVEQAEQQPRRSKGTPRQKKAPSGRGTVGAAIRKYLIKSEPAEVEQPHGSSGVGRLIQACRSEYHGSSSAWKKRLKTEDFHQPEGNNGWQTHDGTWKEYHEDDAQTWREAQHELEVRPCFAKMTKPRPSVSKSVHIKPKREYAGSSKVKHEYGCSPVVGSSKVKNVYIDPAELLRQVSDMYPLTPVEKAELDTAAMLEQQRCSMLKHWQQGPAPPPWHHHHHHVLGYTEGTAPPPPPSTTERPVKRARRYGHVQDDERAELLVEQAVSKQLKLGWHARMHAEGRHHDHRLGPPPPFRGQKWRAGSQRHGNRGGAKAHWWTQFKTLEKRQGHAAAKAMRKGSERRKESERRKGSERGDADGDDDDQKDHHHDDDDDEDDGDDDERKRK